ncbi:MULTISPECIES: hypothetical protein [Aphanothece]|uniref:hypothetical protein n=1 Tax=Aphanothece TaxID=1121 RepID=UPI00398E7E5D
MVLSWTGLLLVLFLVLHLGGVALAVVAPAPFERYAAHLHQAPWLPAAELALLAVALAHIGLSLHKAWGNARAGNRARLSSRRRDPLAAWAARFQAGGGAVLLGFLVVHLVQLRWPRPSAGLELAALQEVLRQPALLLLYVCGALAAGLHLFHGGEAAQRSLGLLSPSNALAIRLSGRSLAVLVGGGFALVALMLGIPAWVGVQP